MIAADVLLDLRIVGRARPAGSKTPIPLGSGKWGVKDTSGDPGAEWRADVRMAATMAMREAGHTRPFEGPLDVAMLFYRQRRKDHYRSDGRRLSAAGLRAEAPITRPDLLKVARSAEDALTFTVWRDDAQIVRELLEKEWADDHDCEPGLRIIVRRWQRR